MNRQLNQSITLARFWGGLVAAGILIYYLQDAHQAIIAKGEATPNLSDAGAQGLSYSATVWEVLPFIITMIGLLGLIVTAIFQRRGVTAP
jgi:hypothetical protein